MGRAILFGLCLVAPAFAGAEERAAEARTLLDEGRFEESLVAWNEVIEAFRAHDLVTSGEAHLAAAECHARLGRAQEAADLLAAYVKAHPAGTGEFKAQRAIFDLWVDAGDAARAQAAGATLLRKYPDAIGCYAVLRTFLESGWKPPKLATSYDVLSRWTFDRTDGRKDPDLRLAFLDLLDKLHPREPAVKEGGTLYSRAWCHLKAGRYEEALALGETYLRKFPGGNAEHSVRVAAAEACLSLAPPDVAKAEKLLKPVLADPKSRRRAEAEALLAAARGEGPAAQVSEGCPRPEGIGRTVLLTNLLVGDARLRALEGWRGARGAEVVRFPGADVQEAAKDLARIGPEFVAVAVAPTTVDINFHLAMLELCRDLDGDPMPDFHFGYLVARDARDLGAFAERILASEGRSGVAAREAVDLRQREVVADLDLLLHFGHGQAWCVEKMITGEEIAELALAKAPVVFSGACFNGVLGRSWHDSQLKPSFFPPKDVPAKRLVSLAWVHAGAAALLAALEGDRGEMAGAEWEHLRSTAGPLGEVIGLEYRLAFTSLPDGFASFPRYVPGRAKRMGFFDVMLRGMVSRILLGDPAYRPLAEPLDPAPARAAVARDEASGTVTVTVEVERVPPFTFVNMLPTKAAFDRRIHARVELPGAVDARYGRHTARAESGGAEIALTRHHLKHEVWGGKRFVNVQVESEDGRLARPGAKATFVIPCVR